MQTINDASGVYSHATNSDFAHEGHTIKANLALVQVIIRGMSGRVQMRKFDLSTTNKDGVSEVVEHRKVTSPHYKIDVHPLWKKISTNRQEIMAVLHKFTVSDSIRGQHLVMMTSIPVLQQALAPLVAKRQSLSGLLSELWDSEVIPGIRDHIGVQQFLGIASRLPSYRSVSDRFNVEMAFFPLTPVTGEDLDLSHIDDPVARQALIDQTNDQAKQMILDRFSTVFDTIFDEVTDICDQVSDGRLESSKCKGSTITSLIDILDRVNNFQEFADPDVLAKVAQTQKILQGTSITNLNSSHHVQSTLKASFKNLSKSVEALQVKYKSGGGRSGRGLDI